MQVSCWGDVPRSGWLISISGEAISLVVFQHLHAVTVFKTDQQTALIAFGIFAFTERKYFSAGKEFLHSFLHDALAQILFWKQFKEFSHSTSSKPGATPSDPVRLGHTSPSPESGNISLWRLWRGTFRLRRFEVPMSCSDVLQSSWSSPPRTLQWSFHLPVEN